MWAPANRADQSQSSFLEFLWTGVDLCGYSQVLAQWAAKAPWQKILCHAFPMENNIPQQTLKPFKEIKPSTRMSKGRKLGAVCLRVVYLD